MDSFEPTKRSPSRHRERRAKPSYRHRRDLVQKTLPLLEPPSQGFDEPLVPLLPFSLQRRLGVGQRRCDGQQETHEQRQRLHRNASIAFEPLDLPCQPIETAREGRFAAIIPSGDRNDVTAASMIADWDSFLRLARSAICRRSSGEK
jgi:hypothetical protein